MKLALKAWIDISIQNIVIVGVLLISIEAGAKEIQSYYVSLEDKSCQTPSKSIRDRYQSRDLEVVECRVWAKIKSAPLSLYVVSSNEHSWIDFVLRDKTWSTEDEIIYKKENQFGNFPSISNAPAEIRMNRVSVAIGLIFRVTAQAPDNQSTNLGVSNVSRLFVIGFGESGACFLGLTRDNESARRLVDSGEMCQRLLKLK
jgi:hypothetical protein